MTLHVPAMQPLSTCEADENLVEALLQAEGRNSERVERRLAAARNNRRMHFQPRECWDLQVASFIKLCKEAGDMPIRHCSNFPEALTKRARQAVPEGHPPPLLSTLACAPEGPSQRNEARTLSR